ncbi:hypothetical protein [Fluviispira multicolorata]|uniref:Uncharacterized protein n=1 Tax=Fluviispira multicolorata TaxID=2654512 RepID=A0A833N4W0_9BACT|nr:hypothetical protein [Fluviispira multicolorata]KAB8033262.1 hypothetical protein GCL57_00780 [Fluviispira multicolorata]
MHIRKKQFSSILNCQKIKQAFSLFSIIISATSINVQAQDIAQNNKIDPTEEVAGGVGEVGYKAPKYAVLPTGKTLPKGIFKLDLPFAYTFGDQGFDSNAKSVSNGLDMSRWVNGIMLQYGLTNSISIGIGIPIVLSNQVSMDGNKLTANSEMYERYYNKFVHELAVSYNSANLCTGGFTVQQCIDEINGGKIMNATTTTPVILPTGELLTIDSGSPIKDQIRNALLTASQPENGATGIGDLQFGILWSVISEESPIRHVPLYFSLGGGLRMPTGKFNLANAMRATGGDNTLLTGGGTYDAIFRMNLDYVATPGVILSWQHVSEYSLTKANLGRSSMLNNKNFNSNDPSVDQSGHTGDQQGNIMTFSRKGLHHIGFLQAAWGLGNVSESLKWLGTFTQLKYNIAAQAYLNGQPIYVMGDQFYLGDSSMHPDHGYEQYYSAAIGAKISGLPYRIPGEISGEFEYPFAGKNRAIAPMNAKGTLTVYF